MLRNKELNGIKQTTQNKTESKMSWNTTGSTSGKVPSYCKLTWPKRNPAGVLQRHSAHLEPVQNLLKQNKE